MAKPVKPAAAEPLDPTQLAAMRDAFWNNIVREMLAGLMMAAGKRPELFDGRFALLTHGHERIPIAGIEPVFGYTVRGTAAERRASAAIQMTVFRVATPDGEVFTLPIHQVRGFHELTPELLQRLERAEAEAERAARGDLVPEPRPFGLAAFAALPKLPPEPAPMHPIE